MVSAKKKPSSKKKKASKKKASSRKKYKNLNLKKKSKKRVSKKKSAKKKAAQRRAKVRKSGGKKSKKRKSASKKSQKRKTKKSSQQVSAKDSRMDSSLVGPWTEVVRPLEDRIIVERVKVKEQSSGGIIIPESAIAAAESHGKVLQVGRGRRDRRGQLCPMEVSIGDKVVFPAFVGVEMKINGVEVVILRENEVWGILTHRVTTRAL